MPISLGVRFQTSANLLTYRKQQEDSKMENAESAKIEPKYFGATPSSVESNDAEGAG